MIIEKQKGFKNKVNRLDQLIYFIKIWKFCALKNNNNKNIKRKVTS